MRPKHIGLKPNLNIIIIFNDMRKYIRKYEDVYVYEKLKKYSSALKWFLEVE